MLPLAFDFIIAWREIRARPNAYSQMLTKTVLSSSIQTAYHTCKPVPIYTKEQADLSSIRLNCLLFL